MEFPATPEFEFHVEALWAITDSSNRLSEQYGMSTAVTRHDPQFENPRISLD